MIPPPPASPTPIADPAALATLMLSRGKYFVLSRVDKSMQAEPGNLPITLNYAAAVRDHTPDSRYFLIEVFGATEDFDTAEEVSVGHRIISLEELIKATFFSDFTTMQESSKGHYTDIESLNLE
jgi:hypothetical protein